jgi:hypothetical protein
MSVYWDAIVPTAVMVLGPAGSFRSPFPWCLTATMETGKNDGGCLGSLREPRSSDPRSLRELRLTEPKFASQTSVSFVRFANEAEPDDWR